MVLAIVLRYMVVGTHTKMLASVELAIHSQVSPIHTHGLNKRNLLVPSSMLNAIDEGIS